MLYPDPGSPFTQCFMVYLPFPAIKSQKHSSGIVTNLVPQIFSPEYYGWSLAKTFAFAPSKMMSTDSLNQGDENTHGPGDRFLWLIHCYKSSAGCDYMADHFPLFIKTLADLYH